MIQKYIIILIGCWVLLLGGQGHSITLKQLVDSSPQVKDWSGFQQGQCFHCLSQDSHVTIDGKTYEISTFRVVGLQGSDTYKTFGDLVSHLKLEGLESETKSLYKDFQDLKFELINLKLEDPKIQIVVSLRHIGDVS